MLTIGRSAVTRALPRVGPGLAKYQRLQALLHKTNVATDRDFQRDFNAFYRVRRGPAWQRVFYAIMEREKRRPRGFEPVLQELHEKLGRHEASFASKLAASINPELPVLDSVVLKKFGLRLPPASSPERLAGIVAVHREVGALYEMMLKRGDGRAVVAAFDKRYPGTDLTDVKKIDLVLWQMREG